MTVTRSTITVKEAAVVLGVHEDTVYTMVKQKQIPHSRIRRRIVFRVDTLNQWLDRQEYQNCGAAI